jgi:nitroimidazol reductase NimA-like FMN-containing flavoprotein (pyridoxamine 5'-phosphate oxidase superfamily)
MTATAAAHRLEDLNRAECLALLATHEVGRLAVVVGGRPLVLPVTYVLDGEHVVFRTAAGSKLAGAVRGPVAFEVDELDARTRQGWSVLVQGRAEEVTAYDSPAARERVTALPLQPWADGDRPHWLRIVPSAVTGRRLGAVPPGSTGQNPR